MPPDDEKQPTSAEATRIVESLHKLLKEAKRAVSAPRPVTFRRLTRGNTSTRWRTCSGPAMRPIRMA
jgi:hypothetical protein